MLELFLCFNHLFNTMYVVENVFSNIDYFKTASGIYANLEIPSPNPTFYDDIQIKDFGKDEKDALENLENELEEYLKYK